MMTSSRGFISLIIGLLVCSSLATSSEAGRRIPAARDMMMPNGIPTAEEATLTGLGCCSAAAFLDQHPHPQQSDTVKKPSRMMAITAPQKPVVSTSSVATTAAPGLGLVSSGVTTKTETPHRPRRSTDVLATTVATMPWEKNTQPVQAIVAVITAFVTAIVLSGMTFFVLACSSGSLLLGRSEADSRMTSDVEKADGYPSFANSQEHCHVSMVYYTIEQPRDSSGGGGGGPAARSKAVLTAAPGGPIESRTEAEVFGAAAALAEKSRLLLACQGELEALKTKLADAEATLEASSSQAISLRSTLAEAQLDLQQAKKTSERRLAQMEEKDAKLSRLEFEAEILALENKRQEEELLDTQEDLSSLSNELYQLSDGDDEMDLQLLSSAAGLRYAS